MTRHQDGKTGSAKAARLAARLALALALVAAPLLAACGKRGPPEPPPGEESEYPRKYPDPSTYAR